MEINEQVYLSDEIGCKANLDAKVGHSFDLSLSSKIRMFSVKAVCA